MNDYINRLKKEFQDNPDLIIKEIKINAISKVHIVFLETLASQDRINEYILKRLKNDIKNIGSNLKKLKQYDEIENYLYNGFTIILKNEDIYALETKADLNRAVSTNETEPAIKGPKDSFVENYQTNSGLIKRRIKSSHLKIKNVCLGRISNTNVGIFYIVNIVNKKLVNNALSILKNIDIDIITDGEDLIKYFNKKSLFPTVISTERPDRVSKSLCEGKIAILTDESPNALILPGFLTDFINPFADEYSKNANINFTKIIRYLCFILSILVPGFYIAIINYNQETIPTSLIINFAVQRNGVPFPATIECMIMLIICEILRESDLRFPSKYGSAISILGALVLGDAAVSAGLVSPIMIIITAFTYISSLIFTDIEISNALRYYRFLILILSSFYGLYGLLLGLIFLIINLTKIYSMGKCYMFPLSPFDKNYFETFSFKIWNKKRSPKLSKNIRKEKV